MVALARAITATDTTLELDDPIETGGYGRIDDELVRITGPIIDSRHKHRPRLKWAIERGLDGTIAAEHDEGATLTRALDVYASGASSPFVDTNGGGGPHTHDDYVETDDARLSDARTPTAHSHSEYATDTDLSDHAATAHGLSSHAIDGAFHTGDEVLPTTGQKNALAGTSGTPGDANRFVTDQDARLTDDRDPTAHTHDTYATDADLTAHAATEHGGEAIPAGVIVMWSGTLATIPSGWALCNGANGTPDLRDRFIVGAANGANPGATGGSATSQHAAHSDHGALTHSGGAVAAHNVTQPSAHGALSHSAHAGATVGNHTDVTNHVHVQNTNSAATGSLVGSAPDTSTNTSVPSGYSTANPTGIGVAAMVHTVGQASAHSDHGSQSHTGTAVDAHAVTQPSQHAAQSHSAHDSLDNRPPFYALAFIIKT